MTGNAKGEIENSGGLTPDELAAEGVTALPDKEVVSILDLNADLNLALDLAAPIDLAVGANANVAAPINAAVGANVLSAGSSAQALSDQGVMITHHIVGDASANATQVSGIDSTGGAAATHPALPATDPTAGAPGATTGVGGVTPSTSGLGGVVSGATGAVGDTVSGIDTSNALGGNVLNVNVNLDANAALTAPVAGAVAANANVAAPIDAAASANIASVASDSAAVAHQQAIIDQSIVGNATANADQTSHIKQ